MPARTEVFVVGVAVIVSILIQGPVLGDDLPCKAKPGQFGQGFICVCNSTYCDTVESPTPLPVTSYYQYKTSNTTPGFNKAIGSFIDSSSSVGDYDAVFTINPSTTYQEIIGFGGSITDASSTIVYDYLPLQTTDKLIESYFGTSGIEYSMLRLPIGGTDFSPRSYTLDDAPYDLDLKQFSLSKEDYYLKIPAIRRAMSKSKRGIKLLGCTWVTPAWMKEGDTVYAGFLNNKYQQAWAEYHLRFLQEYQKENLSIWSLSGNNEAVLQFVYPLNKGVLNSTLMLAPQARHWLKSHLKPLLVANNFSDVKFFGLEDERAFAPYWMETFARDPEAYDALDGLALHWYSDFFIKVDIMDKLHADHPEKMIIYTESSINQEFGESYVVNLGSWHRAEGYLYYIMENLDHWTSAWLDWNLVLDVNGGPTLTSGLDAAIIVNQTSGEFYKQPMFYAMGHFSKFIPPGSRRVQVIQQVTPSKQDEQGRRAAAVELMRKRFSSKSKRSAIPSPSLKNIILPAVKIPETVRCLATTNLDGSFTAMVLNTKNETVHVKIVDERVGVISVDIEQHSVNTFIYWPPTI